MLIAVEAIFVLSDRVLLEKNRAASFEKLSVCIREVPPSQVSACLREGGGGRSVLGVGSSGTCSLQRELGFVRRACVADRR